MSTTSSILISGASGFLGQHLVSYLLKNGQTVVAMSRSPCPQMDNLKKKYTKRLQLCYFDLLTGEGELPEPKNICAMVCCAAIVNSSQNDFHLNVQLARTETLIQRQLDIKKFLVISSQNVEFLNRGAYSQSKTLSELVFKKEVTSSLYIIRPTLIYDDYGNTFIRQLVNIAKIAKIVPQIGIRRAMLQPVHVEDLCEIIYQTLNGNGAESLTVYGGEAISLAKLSKIIKEETKAISVLPIPVSLLKIFNPAMPSIKEKIYEVYEKKTAPVGHVTALENQFSFKIRKFSGDVPGIISNILLRRT